MPISGRVARSDTHLAWRKSGGGRLTAAAHGHVRSRERRHVAAHQHAAATAQDGSSTVAALRRGESRRSSRRGEGRAQALSHAAGCKRAQASLGAILQIRHRRSRRSAGGRACRAHPRCSVPLGSRQGRGLWRAPDCLRSWRQGPRRRSAAPLRERCSLQSAAHLRVAARGRSCESSFGSPAASPSAPLSCRAQAVRDSLTAPGKGNRNGGQIRSCKCTPSSTEGRCRVPF